MFTTFKADFTRTGSDQPHQASTPRPKPKRSQVSRACNGCRLYRTKCDEGVPCKNCRQRGHACSNTKTSSINSLPAATKEINQLQDYIKILETQLERSRDEVKGLSASITAKAAEAARTSQELLSLKEGGAAGTSQKLQHVEQEERHLQRTKLNSQLENEGSSSNSTSESASSPATSVHSSISTALTTILAKLTSASRKTWEGPLISDLQTGEVAYYGPLSMSRLSARLNRHIRRTAVLDCSDVASTFPPIPAPASQIIKSFISEPSGSPSFRDALGAVRLQNSSFPETVGLLSRSQEEQVLDTLWQSFHAIYPILDGADFRSHYESLWASGADQARSPSALTDAMLAVATQYTSSFFRGEHDSTEDLHVAHKMGLGLAFYERSIHLLMAEIESPSLATLQGFIFCIIYLYNSAFYGAASNLLGIAIRIAHTLRLHLRSLNTTAPRQQALHTRVWWTIYQLDTTFAIMLGRPPQIHLDDVTCPLPIDNDELEPSSDGVTWSPSYRDTHWNGFHLQYIRLITIVRGVHRAFQAKCSQYIEFTSADDIYDDPQTLEALAEFINSEARPTLEWAQNVPELLRNKRRGDSGEPFSTDCTPIDFDSSAPIHIQRQRLLLEVMYHNLQLSIFQPFLHLASRSSSITPFSDRNGQICLNYATALTNILSQITSESEIFRGWAPLVQYQWDATLCIMSFLIANPLNPFTPSARKTLQTAIHTFEILGNYCAAARGAVQITRRLESCIEASINQFRSKLGGGSANRGSSADTTADSFSKFSLDPLSATSTNAVSKAFAGTDLNNRTLDFWSFAFDSNQRFDGMQTAPVTMDDLGLSVSGLGVSPPVTTDDFAFNTN